MTSPWIKPSHRPSSYRGLGRMLAASVVLHLVVLGLFAGDLIPRRELVLPPAIRVNLAHRPVEHPQAGRPDAASGKPKVAPARHRPEPHKTVLPAPKPEPKPKPVPKPEPKPKPKPKKLDPKKLAAEKRKVEEAARLQRLQELRQRRQADEAQRERDAKLKALKDKLAGLTTNPGPAGAGTDAPVGEAGGKGDQAGISYNLFVGETIKRNWQLSKYQVASRDLKATAKVLITPDGTLKDFSLTHKSGNGLFDESVRKAILLSRHIDGYSRSRPEWYEIEFNLSDLKD